MKKIIAILIISSLILSQDTTKVVTYYMSGKIKSQGMEVNNFKHGRWTHYDEKGFIIKAEKYNFGKKTEEINVREALSSNK
jgi:antitoxin component YwqK of YwqJK toxin-antitoxin module|tara:strand:+ start:1534 stop:1776 length:243 start_codon:yes stop_codon:yes gene_type:complete